MKRLILLAAVAFFALPAAAQMQEAFPSYIQVNGRAEKEIAPDEFYLQIIINERDSKGKISVESQQRDMIAALKRLGVNVEKQLKVANLSSEFFKKNTSVATAKYQLQLGSSAEVAKVWQALARAEPIDVYPLLRPFAIGLCILFFPTFVIGTINTVLSPVVKGCHGMLESQTFDMNRYREQKETLEREAFRRDPEKAYLASKEDFDKKLDELGWSPKDLKTMAVMYIDRTEYNMKRSIRLWFQELLELLFQSAALVIDTIRTFFLIALSILGPIAFALSVYDGFQSTLTQWITRYISIYMWLPVSDLFSSVLARIQVLMLTRDIEAMSDPTFIPDSSNTVYIIFLIIGIFGYFTIPTVANWIIMAGGVSHANRAMNQTATKVGNVAAAGAGAAVGNIAGRIVK